MREEPKERALLLRRKIKMMVKILSAPWKNCANLAVACDMEVDRADYPKYGTTSFSPVYGKRKAFGSESIPGTASSGCGDF